MYESQLKFIDFAASRNLSRIDQWAETLVCPIIRIDNTIDWCETAANIAEHFHDKKRAN